MAMNNTVTILIIALLFAGCVDDAPRDNPLDPLSPNYSKEGSLTGKIFVTNQSTGIAGATVLSTTESIAVTTDSSGNFTFGKLSSGTHQLVISKDNFISDTFQVAVPSGSSVFITRGLNGAPVVTFQQILTRKIDQYFPSPQYFVDVIATVSDPNGVNDMDSVWFGVDTLKYPMTFSNATKNYHATIFKYDFPTNTIQWLVGKQLAIISRDVNKAVNIGTPFFVTRVIENEATPISPSPFIKDTVSADSVIFKWSPPDVTYNYSYTITLSRVIGGTQTVEWTHVGLNSFYEELEYNGAQLSDLPANFVWTVTVVDDFGNYGRSKESAFVIK